MYCRLTSFENIFLQDGTCIRVRVRIVYCLLTSFENIFLQDGTCIIYTARKGEYVLTLRPMGMQLNHCHVTSLALSEHGNIVVYCKQESNRALCRYSINGKLLSKDVKLKDDVAALFISNEYVVTGDSKGRLEIRGLHRFELFLVV